MRRVVEPELLDELPRQNPLAQGSREDLQRLNAWMGHAGILSRQLQRLPTQPSRRLLDLGSGDGRFMWQVAKRLPRNWRGTGIDLLDRRAAVAPQARKGFEQLGWRAASINADVSQFLLNVPEQQWSIICANLFLHHFAETSLRELLELVSQHTAVFVAIEPRRSLWSLLASRMVGLLGCNRVTRHDAPVSVRAGFSAKALSDLWPDNGTWRLQEHAAGFFSHLFIARRDASADV